MLRRGTCIVACLAASSCGGAAFADGGVRVVPDRAYVFDDGDSVYVSAYLSAHAEDERRSVGWDVKVAWSHGREWGCASYAGFAADLVVPPSTLLARGEARDLRVVATAERFLACEHDQHAVACGEPVTVVLVPRGDGPVVTMPTTADCFLRVR